MSKFLATIFTAVLVAGFVSDASAGIRVKCESRDARSRVSIDGRDLLPGTYTARLTSGSNEAVAPAQDSIGDEVQFDFDSNANDVADGATPIAANFIQGGQATGKILDASGDTVISDTVNCKQ